MKFEAVVFVKLFEVVTISLSIVAIFLKSIHDSVSPTL